MPNPPKITPQQRIAERLGSALDQLESADNLISLTWADFPETRTPRMADIVSLIDRARSKLRKEVDRAKPA